MVDETVKVGTGDPVAVGVGVAVRVTVLVPVLLRVGLGTLVPSLTTVMLTPGTTAPVASRPIVESIVRPAGSALPASAQPAAPAPPKPVVAPMAAPVTPSLIAPAAAAAIAPGRWQWPTEGPIIGRYVAGDPTQQGIDIAGQAGQPVLAAADGVVVYSGTGLVGYGEVIIVKHNDEWLSAYGHNRSRLVAEGVNVRAGQTIAELGRSGTSRDMLHFEIRRNGKPVDPTALLPTGRSPSAAEAKDGRERPIR